MAAYLLFSKTISERNNNMSEELKRTYVPFTEWAEKSKQTEYTEPTPLLNPDGTLNARGWARHNVFEYDRSLVKRERLISKKEWDYYTVTDGRKQLLVSFAHVGIGGFMGCRLIDLHTGEVNADVNTIFVGGNKHVPLNRIDAPGRFSGKSGDTEFDFHTKENERTVYFKKSQKGQILECNLHMDIPEGLESITTVLPFKEDNTKFFMTTKQNCMPVSGVLTFGDYKYEFTKDTSFCSVDWGKVNTPRKLVWYWGSAATYLPDENGKNHIFGFEITWAIGDESHATETCLFYDGKVHKIGAVDVEKFPKDRYMEEWKIVSEDGRFNMTMTPTYNNKSDLNLGPVARMLCNQIYGKWNGNVILDDGTKLEIRDLFAFCEYVENRW
ncbi:MAG: DUF2804 domain-containing protein [Ruminococcaceae bacterium]|nr:DUF2804 domain-containing protein [Oscillospiraceae bacterium]